MTDTKNHFSQELDVTGLLCPIPVLRARRTLDEMAPGDLLLVIASDPASVQDMPAFCRMSGHKLHMARAEGGRYMFEIEKGVGRPADDAEIGPIRRTR